LAPGHWNGRARDWVNPGKGTYRDIGFQSPTVRLSGLHRFEGVASQGTVRAFP